MQYYHVLYLSKITHPKVEMTTDTMHFHCFKLPFEKNYPSFLQCLPQPKVYNQTDLKTGERADETQVSQFSEHQGTTFSNIKLLITLANCIILGKHFDL